MSTQMTGLETDWRKIADELAVALQDTMLRNPTVSARDWNRAYAALGRYEEAGGARPTGQPATIPETPEELTQ